MRRTLRNRLLVSYLLLVALFGGGVALTLFVVKGLGRHSELLVDRYWQESQLLNGVHDLLSEVALFLNAAPEEPESVAVQVALQKKIDDLVGAITSSSLRDDFRGEQVERLGQLKAGLAEPFAVLARLERQTQVADEALVPLLAEASRLARLDLLRDLTVAALAYRDYRITANPSDLEIFRQQVERIARRPASPEFSRQFGDFRREGEAVFARRQELRSSRDQIVTYVRDLAQSLRGRSEEYSREIILPVREEIRQGLNSIPNILLTAVLAGGLAALLTSLILARRISVPMERAAVALRRIEQGDLDARLESSENEEVALLGRAINSLALSLRQTLNDLHQTVQRLQLSEEGYRQIAEQRLVLERIINGSPTVAFLCRCEAGFPVQFVSASVAQFGYRSEPLCAAGQPILELVDPLDRQRLAELVNAHLATREEHEFFLEFRVVTPQGERRWVDGRLLLGYDGQGAATHLQGVLLDITEKISLREQAAQASRLASLGELAAGVAHEINNPNATILFNAAVLKEIGEGVLKLLDEVWRERGGFQLGRIPYPRLREEIPRLQAEVLEAAGRIRRIVDDLKEFAGADRPELCQEVDLNAVVQAAVRLTGNALKKATDNFSASYEPELPLLKGHSQRLEQVAVNLLMNACQALPGRQRGISVRTAHLADEHTLCLEVADEGVGIAADELSHVTDPFFTTRRDRGGTGLGLSVSARIVREHGGQLLIDSVQGSGTRVRILLPLPPKEPSA